MTDVEISKPLLDDGKKIFELVKNSPPLDVNSEYAYLLLCHHFSDTCAVAKKDSKVIGFLSA
ncbi:MAG: diaminobutyrate acetyltransferase, partial [Nitrosopumilaceae archaeon]